MRFCLLPKLCMCDLRVLNATVGYYHARWFNKWSSKKQNRVLVGREVKIPTIKSLINIHDLSNNDIDLDWSLPLNGKSFTSVNKWSKAESKNWKRNHKLLTNTQKNTMTYKTDKLNQTKPQCASHTIQTRISLNISSLCFNTIDKLI